MLSSQKFLARLAGLILVAGFIAFNAGNVQSQNRANFDQQTVAKRYHMNFFGSGKNASSMSGVGWFEVDEAGNITIAKFSVVASGSVVNSRSNFELAPGGFQTLTLKDATSGRYELDLLLGHNDENVRLILQVLLDDPRGRSGKAAGSYSFHITLPFDDQGAGALAGEITAQ